MLQFISFLRFLAVFGLQTKLSKDNTCKKRRKHECDKSHEHKDNLELYVTTCVRDFLSNRENAETAVNDVLDYYDKRTDEQNIKSRNTYRRRHENCC